MDAVGFCAAVLTLRSALLYVTCAVVFYICAVLAARVVRCGSDSAPMHVVCCMRRVRLCSVSLGRAAPFSLYATCAVVSAPWFAV
jgi:hypothetical protein